MQGFPQICRELQRRLYHSGAVRRFGRRPVVLPIFAALTASRNARAMCPGGGSGIRTHDTVSRIHAFQASALSHSAIPPKDVSANITTGGMVATERRDSNSDGRVPLFCSAPAPTNIS